ncbi:hypothetical protein AruPA_11375 [Acidiphilium sp. PA]|uniref:hypothetical protein n=1 Tax=Acidiphilium sp. PA TaxID=2871705 RepID=UPI00224478EF|nr:hypothetical protein [Acidiphilium sp. PA]MCW8307641.1 hypothetical protein [Acidiphilium sp. PA]
MVGAPPKLDPAANTLGKCGAVTFDADVATGLPAWSRGIMVPVLGLLWPVTEACVVTGTGAPWLATGVVAVPAGIAEPGYDIVAGTAFVAAGIPIAVAAGAGRLDRHRFEPRDAVRAGARPGTSTRSIVGSAAG